MERWEKKDQDLYMKADDNHMKINIGNHEFTELRDGVLYKALSDYPRRDEKGCGLKGLKIAQYLAQTKEKLCKVIPKYAKNVNKNTIIEILQNCCKCRKYSKR